MNWRVVGPLFAVVGVAAFSVGACAPQDVADDGGGSGGDTSGSGTGGNGNVSSYCGQAAQCPVDDAGVDLVTPVSFATQVFPIFQKSCALQACHINPGASAGNWLGPQEGMGEATTETFQAIIDGLEQPSTIAPSMQLVAPGDWKNSFLMHKVDGCQDALGLTCQPIADVRDCFSNPCGASMPQLDDPDRNAVFPLPEADRNIIRAWIAQGANNN